MWLHGIPANLQCPHLRQLRFVLNTLPKLASLTYDQVQYRWSSSTQLKPRIDSNYINNRMRRSEAFRWYTACYQIEIDRPNVLEDYLTTHRRDFHQFNTKYEQRIYFLQYFQDYWCVLWGLYRIPSSPWCPFFYTPISHTFEYAPRIWKEFIIKVTGDAFLILREYFICFLRSLKCLKVTKLSLSMISTRSEE